MAKIRAAISMGIIKRIKGGLDYEACGGAAFLGLSKMVVKAHGNSRARGFAICINQAAKAVRGNLVENIKTLVDENAELVNESLSKEE